MGPGGAPCDLVEPPNLFRHDGRIVIAHQSRRSAGQLGEHLSALDDDVAAFDGGATVGGDRHVLVGGADDAQVVVIVIDRPGDGPLIEPELPERERRCSCPCRSARRSRYFVMPRADRAARDRHAPERLGDRSELAREVPRRQHVGLHLAPARRRLDVEVGRTQRARQPHRVSQRGIDRPAPVSGAVEPAALGDQAAVGEHAVDDDLLEIRHQQHVGVAPRGEHAVAVATPASGRRC